MQKDNTKKWLGLAVVVLLIINITILMAFWLSHKRMNNNPPSKGGASAFIIKELKLDSAQQEAYKLLKEEHIKGVRAIKEQIKDNKETFFQLLADTTISEQKVKEEAAKSVSLEQEIDVLTFKHFQQVRNLCTPEQKKKFDSILSEVTRLMGAPPQHGPPPQRGRENGRPPLGDRDANFPPPPGGEMPPPDRP